MRTVDLTRVAAESCATGCLGRNVNINEEMYNALSGQELLPQGGAPGKHLVLHLNQSGCGKELRGGRGFLASRNQFRHPYLAVGVVGVAFAVATFQSRADSPDLIHAYHHSG